MSKVLKVRTYETDNIDALQIGFYQYCFEFVIETEYEYIAFGNESDEESGSVDTWGKFPLYLEGRDLTGFRIGPDGKSVIFEADGTDTFTLPFYVPDRTKLEILVKAKPDKEGEAAVEEYFSLLNGKEG